ncbi:MAG: hypothetical protein ACM3TR_09315 [Caulobacteraceae bacterium]
MANGFGYGAPAVAGAEGGSFFQLLSNFIGETVTIFTTSGGQSGAGFTGVVLAVNPCFVRLVTHIGPAPGCALGNCCSPAVTGGYGGMTGGYGGMMGGYGGMMGGYGAGYGGGVVHTVGSVADIPLDRIASFVHNAV